MSLDADNAAASTLECCGNCVFAMIIANVDVPTGEMEGDKPVMRQIPAGYCRRFPPTMSPVMQSTPSRIVGAPVQIATALHPTFPNTHIEQWCGEHTRVEEYDAFKAARLGVVEDLPLADQPES